MNTNKNLNRAKEATDIDGKTEHMKFKVVGIVHPGPHVGGKGKFTRVFIQKVKE